MFRLAGVLHAMGFAVTVFHTRFNAPDPARHPGYRFVPVHDGVSGPAPVATDDVVSHIFALNAACEAPFRDSVAAVLEEYSRDAVACLVADGHLLTMVEVAYPLHMLFPAAGSRLLRQDRSCLEWLDPRPPESVLYVSFGSLACMAPRDLVETAWGIAGSGVPFLWVVRPGMVRGCAAHEPTPLPEGFEEATRGRGMVVAWAPQEEVSRHTAESLCEGVPMLCRPYFGDQMGNARYVEHVWRVGFEVDGDLERGSVAAAIRRLDTDKDGAEMRARAGVLHAMGFAVTVFHTRFNAPDPARHPGYRFVPVHDGVSGPAPVATDDVVFHIFALNAACEAPFRDSLAAVLEEYSRDTVACLVADGHLLTMVEVAARLAVPTLVLHTGSAACFSCFVAYPLLCERGYLPAQESSQLETLVTELPPYRVRDLMQLGRDKSHELMRKMLARTVAAVQASSGLILNTFDALERPELGKLRRDLATPVFDIGPLHMLSPAAGSSLLLPDWSCLEWLDARPPESVLYVSFGSLACMAPRDLVETAWGIAGSGVPFPLGCKNIPVVAGSPARVVPDTDGDNVHFVLQGAGGIGDAGSETLVRLRCRVSQARTGANAGGGPVLQASEKRIGMRPGVRIARDACWDVVLAEARDGDTAARIKVLFSNGICFLCQRVLDWVCERAGQPRDPRPPHKWSWLSIMGSAIINNDGSCTIAACMMCIEAQHRLVFERLHGPGSFQFKVKGPRGLKKRCQRRGVWYPKIGAWVEDILDVIKSTKGVPTIRVPNDIYLPVLGYKILNLVADRVTPWEAASYIFNLGPLVGTLRAEGNYNDCNGDNKLVYRGGQGNVNHAIVCVAYRFVGDELHIRIKDNHKEDGPLRWIHYSVFQQFFLIYVDPIDPKLLRRKKRWRRGDIITLHSLLRKIFPPALR